MKVKFPFLSVNAVIFFAVCCFQISWSQKKITGSVMDAKGNPVIAANVLLLNAKDSGLVKGVMTDNAGQYLFDNISEGKFLISSTIVGFKQAYTNHFSIDDKHGIIDLGKLELAEANVLLKGVTVTTKKPLFEQKIDRMVINVKNSITAAGGTALDVLEKSPGVVVDRQNNSISLLGKNGVMVMINGRLNRMPLSAVVQMLAGMSSDNIEKIELITTPPANYDAEGNAGFINIVFVNNPYLGINGSYSIKAGYGRGEMPAASINFNYRNNKMNLYGDFSATIDHMKQYLSFYRRIETQNKTTENISQTDRDATRNNYNVRLGIDYQLSYKTTVGILAGGYDSRWSMDAVNSDTIKMNKNVDSIINISLYEINYWQHFMTNVNLQHAIKADETISFDFNYLYYKDDNPITYKNDYFDKYGSFLFQQPSKTGKITPIHFWVGASDYKKALNKKINMEAGIKASLSKFVNDVQVQNLIQNNWMTDKELTAKYFLNEDIYAAYASFTVTLDDKTSIKSGLRYEYTTSNLNTADVKNIVDRKYGELFPTFFISRKFKENTASFSYSRRITRPTFNDMAPFVIFIDPNTFFSGNPALRPSISNSVQLNYSLKKYVFSLSFTHEKDFIANFQSKIDTAKNKQTLASENLDNVLYGAANISLPFTVTKWWSMQNNITGTWQKVQSTFDNSSIKLQQIVGFFNSTQSFKLPKDYSLELSGFFRTKGLFGTYTVKPFWSMDFGAQKKFKKSSLRFAITDIFATRKFKSYLNMPEKGYYMSGYLDFGLQEFKLIYSYNFGNKALKEKRSRSTGSEDELNRVQQ